MPHLFRCIAALLSAGFLLLPSAHASSSVSGFVTRAGTPESYFVNEEEVKCKPGSTRLRTLTPGQAPEEHIGCSQWVVGDQLTIDGSRDKKSNVLTAENVEVDKPIPLAVNGFAIVDRVLIPLKPGSGTLRADGYALHITPGTKLVYAEGSGLTLQTLGTNMWVRYTGTLRTDGTVDASSLLFSPNSVSGTEDRLRKKTEFDASHVKEEDK